MTIRKKMVCALALAALAAFMLASTAMAGHPRPKGATPILVSLVPAFKQCTLPNSTHGTPLASPSCNPPVQTSTYLTMGSPDAGGGAANMQGTLRLDVIVGVPGAPDDSDVKLSGSISDVRCKVGAGTVCGTANAANGPDYAGEVQGNAMIRISDHYNGGPAFTTPATVQDLPFPVTVPCTQTSADTTKGSTCAVNTTANGVVPGVVKDGKRAVVEVQQLHINDGGADGLGSTDADNTLYLNQGIFIP
jgi:hypothetical protein